MKPVPLSGCARVQARLPLLVDGALSLLDGARDRGHLEACAACSQALAEHEAFLARLRAAGTSALEPDVALVNRAVLARVASLASPRPRRKRTLPVLLVAAAAVLLVCLRWFYGDAEFAPRKLELASLDPLLEHWPSWSEVVSGLGHLTRWISA